MRRKTVEAKRSNDVRALSDRTLHTLRNDVNVREENKATGQSTESTAWSMYRFYPNRVTVLVWHASMISF